MITAIVVLLTGILIVAITILYALLEEALATRKCLAEISDKLERIRQDQQDERRQRSGGRW
jgi:hypothetical protein